MFYVDGFVIPVPKKNLKTYVRIARIGKEIWMKHGDLDYKECVGEDLKKPVGDVFSPDVEAEAGRDRGVFVHRFKSRAHRDPSMQR